MKGKITILAIGIMAVSVSTYLAFATTALTEGEFGRLLFDRLQLVKLSKTLAIEEKITALEELGFAPHEPYKIEQKLTLGKMSIILVKVYGLQSHLPARFSEDEALKLLVKKEIIPEAKNNIDDTVSWEFGAEMVDLLPDYPGPHDPDMPLFICEPPMSDIE